MYGREKKSEERKVHHKPVEVAKRDLEARFDPEPQPRWDRVLLKQVEAVEKGDQVGRARLLDEHLGDPAAFAAQRIGDKRR
jgi:hypothetical protein